MTTAFLVTIKSSLLPLVVLFGVCVVAQVSDPTLQPQPNTDPEANAKVIKEFCEEVKNFHKEMAFIRRDNDKDVVVRDSRRYAKRTISVTVYAYWNRKWNVGFWEYWKTSITKKVSVGAPTDVERFYNWFLQLGLIPPFEETLLKSSKDDINKMNQEIATSSGTVFHEYFIESVKAIHSQYNEKLAVRFKDQTSKEAANYVVPLARDIFKVYDGAIDYITLEYEKHCLKSDGIVQKNSWQYLQLWWSSVSISASSVPNRNYSQEDLTAWDAFMATACPFPDNITNPETPGVLHEKANFQLADLNESLSESVDFEQEVAVPEQVEKLQPHLPMMKGYSKYSELIGQLVTSFGEYKKLDDAAKKAHDDNLWLGYQKKLIVLQTIVRVMHKDVRKDTENTNISKSDLVAPNDEDSNRTPKPQVIPPPLPSKSNCWTRAMNWPYAHPCYTITGATILAAIIAGGVYLWNSANSTPTSDTFSNRTLSTIGSIDTGALPSRLVWWIVAAMIVGAIVCCAYCLICRKKRRSSTDSARDKTPKIDARKDKKQVGQGAQVRMPPNGPTSGSASRTAPSSTVRSTVTPSKIEPGSIWKAWFTTKPAAPIYAVTTNLYVGSEAANSQTSDAGHNSRVSAIDSGAATAQSSATYSSYSPSNASSISSNASSTFKPSTASSSVGGASVVSLASSSAASTLNVSPSNVTKRSSIAPPSSSGQGSQHVVPPKKSPSQVPKSPSKCPTGKDTTKSDDPRKDAQKKKQK